MNIHNCHIFWSKRVPGLWPIAKSWSCVLYILLCWWNINSKANEQILYHTRNDLNRKSQTNLAGEGCRSKRFNRPAVAMRLQMEKKRPPNYEQIIAIHVARWAKSWMLQTLQSESAWSQVHSYNMLKLYYTSYNTCYNTRSPEWKTFSEGYRWTSHAAYAVPDLPGISLGKSDPARGSSQGNSCESIRRTCQE